MVDELRSKIPEVAILSVNKYGHIVPLAKEAYKLGNAVCSPLNSATTFKFAQISHSHFFYYIWFRIKSKFLYFSLKMIA